jgi:hypothetical protein
MKVRILCLAVILTGCSSSNGEYLQQQTIMDKLDIPSAYGKSCFMQSSLHNKFESLISQYSSGEISRDEFLKTGVTLCPSQPDRIIWLSEQIEKSSL